MNEVIQKAVEELSKESPDISYIRGMLETVLAMNESPRPYAKVVITDPVRPEAVSTEFATDEGAILDAQTRALMGKIPPQTE